MSIFSDRPQTAADVVRGLRAVADKLSSLDDTPTPNMHVSISLQPSGTEEEEVAVIDRLGEALRGAPGATCAMSGGTFHHKAEASIDGIRVAAFTSVTSPKERELRAEVERLRAQVGQQSKDQRGPEGGPS